MMIADEFALVVDGKFAVGDVWTGVSVISF